MTNNDHDAESVRLIRTIHPRSRGGTLTATEPFKLGIEAKIVSVEWDDEVAAVTWLVPDHSDGKVCNESMEEK